MSIKPNSASSLSGLFEAVHGFFAPRLICIAYCKYAQGKQPEFKIASGFIMVFDEIPVLVTAGHACQEIHDMKLAGDLHGVSLVFAKSKFNDGSFNLDTEDLPMFWWDDADDLDVGFMFLEPAIQRQLLAFDVKAIPREVVSLPSSDPEKPRLAIGFSAEHTIVSDSATFYVVQDGDVKPVVKSEVGALGRRIVAMSGFGDRRKSQFVARPIREEELTVAGMSGGIIVELDGGKAVRDFRLVGIQSGQTFKERKDGKQIATGFFVNDAVLAIECIRRKLASFSDIA